MREIKFRIYFEDEEPFMTNPISIEDLLHEDWIEFENEDNTVSLPLKDFRFFYEKNKNYKIMQYTGLHDKNGTEIYEGDIVRTHYIGGIGVENDEVIFDRGCFCVNYSEDYHPLLNEVNHCSEVIGNIYENPELLEHK